MVALYFSRFAARHRCSLVSLLDTAAGLLDTGVTVLDTGAWTGLVAVRRPTTSGGAASLPRSTGVQKCFAWSGFPHWAQSFISAFTSSQWLPSSVQSPAKPSPATACQVITK